MDKFTITCNKCGSDNCNLESIYTDEYDYDRDYSYEKLQGVDIQCFVCGNNMIID